MSFPKCAGFIYSVVFDIKQTCSSDTDISFKCRDGMDVPHVTKP